jgi:hypothetical protein
MSRLAPFAALGLVPTLLAAQQPPQSQAPAMTFGGFVDTYIAWDTGRPATIDRPYTTQAARHAEFNVNLAFIDAILSGDRVRGRLALQAGTSVQANYLTEPSVGRYSGPSLAQYVQEAVVGARIAKSAWVDAGIFLSHTGSETWVSRDNLTYTRSLVADFSPYYESGVKLTWQVRPDVTALFTVVNGWQKISENNADKSVGVRLDWAVSPHITLGYYNLIGNEEPDSVRAQVRFFNGMTAKWTSHEWTLIGTISGGRQNDGSDAPPSWWGASLVAHAQTTEHTAFSGRVETFSDPHSVIVQTGTDSPFRAFGGSFGLDFTFAEGVTWRTEFRGLRSQDAIFVDSHAPTGRSKTNAVFISSLAVTF